MDVFLKSLVVAVLGVALGLASTWLAVERGYGFGAVQAGSWNAWPKTGSNEADPYAKAVMARTGEIPLGAAEGLSFLAQTDADGTALNSRCAYSVHAPIPSARFWTLTALSPVAGHPLSVEGRLGITSAEIIRKPDSTFEISLSREVKPGNWLPLPAAVPFQLMLRLYDTQVSSTAAVIDARTMPRITRGACT